MVWLSAELRSPPDPDLRTFVRCMCGGMFAICLPIAAWRGQALIQLHRRGVIVRGRVAEPPVRGSTVNPMQKATVTFTLDGHTYTKAITIRALLESQEIDLLVDPHHPSQLYALGRAGSGMFG